MAYWIAVKLHFLALLPMLQSQELLQPKVLIALFIRNKAHVLRDTLSLLEQQDYPKSRVALYVVSDHNEDETLDILIPWLDSQGEFHSKKIDIDHDRKRFLDQEQGPLHWSPQRFQYMIQIKEKALDYARQMWADWIWFYDIDTFITNPQTLSEMVTKSNLTVVAPMLTSVGLYANFWAGMSETYYYKRTDEYKLILDRKKRGCFAVPMVHSSIFINLNHKDSQLLTFHVSQKSVPQDDIITFALSASFNGINLHICNDLGYGYVMLPMDDEQSLEDDEENLTNLRTEMFAYGHKLAASTHSKEPLDTLGMDEVYLINLERRPDRLSNMQHIFNELQIKFKLINAVDGKFIDETYLSTNGIEMMKDFSEPFHGRPLTYGEIGCFMSHYAIWKDIIEQNHQKVVVFEDDVRFEPFFRKKFNAVQEEIESLQLDPDLIFLGRKILHNVEEHWVEDSQWLVHVNYTYWTLGYMLSNKGAKKLVDENPLAKMVPVDEYLPIMYDRHPNKTWKSHFVNRNLVAYSVHPLLLFPTHYTGEDGYISDTEDTPTMTENHHDEL